MIELRTGTRIWLAAGVTDMRRGFDGLSAQVQTVLEQQPFSGHVFRIPWTPRRHRKAFVVRWRWSLSFRQAFGARTVHLAEGRERNRLSEPRAAVDAAGRHRLEKTRAHLDAADCGLIDECDSPLFMRLLCMFSTSFHGILRAWLLPLLLISISSTSKR